MKTNMKNKIDKTIKNIFCNSLIVTDPLFNSKLISLIGEDRLEILIRTITTQQQMLPLMLMTMSYSNTSCCSRIHATHGSYKFKHERCLFNTMQQIIVGIMQLNKLFCSNSPDFEKAYTVCKKQLFEVLALTENSKSENVLIGVSKQLKVIYDGVSELHNLYADANKMITEQYKHQESHENVNIVAIKA